jgi:hypothetical protein
MDVSGQFHISTALPLKTLVIGQEAGNKVKNIPLSLPEIKLQLTSQPVSLMTANPNHQHHCTSEPNVRKMQGSPVVPDGCEFHVLLHHLQFGVWGAVQLSHFDQLTFLRTV